MLYRSHFAMIRNPLITTTGLHTSALFGFMNQMLRLLRDENPDYIAAVFDTDKKTFRHHMYPDYKATREKMPDELRDQIPWLWKLLEAMRIPTLSKEGFEADDIIGTLAKRGEAQGLDVYLVSGDKDFMQLISNQVFMIAPGTRSSGPVLYDRKGVEKKWGVPPEKIVDLLGLMGDASDNVPGVRGVGEKSAVKLIAEYGSLEAALENANNIGNKRVQNGLLECREAALLSKKLVTIDTDVSIDESIDDLKLNKFDYEQLAELFTELEFFALLNQITPPDSSGAQDENQIEKTYRNITNADDLKNLVQDLEDLTWLSIDLETTSVDPMRAEIVGIALSFRKDEGYYIPIVYPEQTTGFIDGDDLQYVLGLLKPIIENPKIQKTGQNIKYDALILSRHQIVMKGISFDTMVAAHLLNPEFRSLKLETLALEYLNYSMIPIEELIGTGRVQLLMADVPLEKIGYYAAEDADIALQITEILAPKLEDVNLKDFFHTVELPLIPVLIDMEKTGAYVDPDILAEMSERLGRRLEELSQEILREAGTEFNINSTQQLAVVLFDTLELPQIKKRSTAEEVLHQLQGFHPLPGMVLEYRKLNKLKNTYLDSFPDFIHPDTGRIHTNYSQTIAATGRLSSSSPNFQNIPIRTSIGREIRKAFRAQEPEYAIFSADYSQIELRIMAHLSHDKGLLEAFQKGQDVHAKTASLVYNVPLEEVTSDMRRTAKIVNFGIMYGAGPFRMSQELGLPRNEAQKIIDQYFERYAGIKDYIARTIEQAREKKYVQTLLGRRRPVWDADSTNRLRRDAAERMAINMPIQGTAAELIKLAMINIHADFIRQNLKSTMILQVHDELIFEVHQDEIETVKSIVISRMESGLKLDVPLKVDWGIGQSWFEAH